MGLLSLTYTRPKRVDQPPTSRSSSDPFSETEKSDSSVRSDRSGYSAGIPDSLSFDKIVNGGTCPVSLHCRAISRLAHSYMYSP